MGMHNQKTTRKILIGKLFERMRQITRDINSSKKLLFGEHNLSKTEGDILFIIAHEKRGETIKELSKSLKVTHGAISQFVESMTKKGLVSRESDEYDGRITRVILSEKAKEEFKIFEKTHFRKISAIFDELNNEEIETLTGLLTKIKQLNKS